MYEGGSFMLRSLITYEILAVIVIVLVAGILIKLTRLGIRFFSKFIEDKENER